MGYKERISTRGGESGKGLWEKKGGKARELLLEKKKERGGLSLFN